MMSGLIFGGVLIVGGCAWWLSHSFDLEPSHKSFYAAMVALVGLGVCVGSAISMLPQTHNQAHNAQVPTTI